MACVGIGALWGFAPTAVSATVIQHHYFYTSDGVRLHYLEAGKGQPTLLWIPGWLMPAQIFEAQLKALARQQRVVVLDPRSQGKSALAKGSHSAPRRARDIDEWIQKLHVDAFVLAGWSLGVMEGLDYVERYQPSQLKGLILIDNSIGFGAAPPASTATPEPALSHQAYLHRFVRAMFKHPPTEEFLRMIDASTLRLPAPIAAQLLAKPYPREYYHDAILHANVPVLYAITSRLGYQGEALTTEFPQARVVVYPNAGHALFVDEADQFNSDVTAFVRSLPAASAH